MQGNFRPRGQMGGARRDLLEGCGYALCDHPSAVRDWYDEKQVCCAARLPR
jgi:hypothetical protein